MDLIEDEPRKYPKPVPFSQSGLPRPIVPEVSLLLQDNFANEKKNDSFSGTEFQTYNAWRWKHMNGKHDQVSSENRTVNKYANNDRHYSRDDKTFTDIEKRKNEILYGEVDEPRRPLPPRASAVIPKCPELLLSSFEDIKVVNDVKDKYGKLPDSVRSQDKNALNCHNLENLKHGLDNSDKLFDIISEQIKQIDVLQNQIKQLLKIQEVKDKQIAQLLRSQELKEGKIEQLLESLESKDREVDQLIRLKDQQDQHLQELLKSEEEIRKENGFLLKKINDSMQKDVHTVGVTACIETFDASTNTNFDCCKNQEESTPVKEISCNRDINESNRYDAREKSISLHSADLPIIREHQPTPQSSIHLDIQDFLDSSDECESDSAAQSNNFFTSGGTHSNPLGYTFYNNVLAQVKEIIKNSGAVDAKENSNGKLDSTQRVRIPQTNYNCVTENRGTVKSFEAWDVSERENIPSPNEEERFLYKTPSVCYKDLHSPSDVSLKINALAMKYLKQEQISQYNLQSQIPSSCQHDVTIYNVTNLSFGSMRNLDRYKILPRVLKHQQDEVNVQPNNCSPSRFLQMRKKMSVQENITSSIGNILDINTLNQQPKLL